MEIECLIDLFICRVCSVFYWPFIDIAICLGTWTLFEHWRAMHMPRAKLKGYTSRCTLMYFTTLNERLIRLCFLRIFQWINTLEPIHMWFSLSLSFSLRFELIHCLTSSSSNWEMLSNARTHRQYWNKRRLPGRDRGRGRRRKREKENGESINWLIYGFSSVTEHLFEKK